jgi:uncharacterized protein Veg
MLSQTSRYCFICELGVKTLYDYFTPPPAIQIFTDLKASLDEGVDLFRDFGSKRVTLTKIAIDEHWVTLLFRLTNPDIPDGVLEKQADQSLRVAERQDGEVPARSAHVVIDARAKFDIAAAYPMVVENVEYLSKSVVSSVLNQVLKELLTEERLLDDGGKLKSYSPRIEIRGHQSQTLEDVLNTGGSLQGLKFVKNKVEVDAFGDQAYAATSYEEINMKITGKPSGLPAMAFIRQKVQAQLGQGLETAKVVIEDQSGRTKTSPLNLELADVAANIFILQKIITDFENPLAVCEAEIRNDVVQKMRVTLP